MPKPRRHIRIAIFLGLGVVLILLALVFRPSLQRFTESLWQQARGRATVASRVTQYGPAARGRLRPDFEKADVAYPPLRVVLAAFKDEKRMEVYAADREGALRFVREYPILAASGKAGPKLGEGDNQVPEGLYRIESLNPNSAYHLALRVNYPNAFDRDHARLDGRTDLGGAIMVHGSIASIGCLAMGDEASEDLFVLAAETGMDNVRVIIAPTDLRTNPLPEIPDAPAWASELYGMIKEVLAGLPSH